jgi:uncharacterized protein (TIGR03086 family)
VTGDHPAGGAEAALHDAALDAAVAVVDEIPDGAWDDPTPCSDWTVRAIVGHLAWGNLVLTGALRGAPFHDPAGGRTVVLPHPPPSAYRATVDEVRRALRAPGIPAAVAFPTGDLPLPAALRVRVQDLVVHLWDLSIATGTPLRVDDELIDAAYRTARERRAAGLLPAAQFAPPGDLTTACSPLDRLLLTVGRHPR